MLYLTAKFQKKVMNGFRETASRMNERTNERTNERDSLGLQRLRRETKKHSLRWLISTCQGGKRVKYEQAHKTGGIYR